MPQPVLVILAAGASSRLGQCKALARLGERPAIRVLLDAASGLLPGRPVVVTGAHHLAIQRALATDEVDVLENPAWELGRTGSLALAAQAWPGRDFLVAPVDHPLVLRSTIEALLDGWARQGCPALGWLGPRHAETFGHPVIIGRELLDCLQGLAPNTSLRDLRDQAQGLCSVLVHDPGVLLGLDTPTDLARLREATHRPRGPMNP